MIDFLPLPGVEDGAVSDAKPAESKPKYDVRKLTLEEIRTLAPIFQESGADLPDPSTSFFIGAVDSEDKIVGFLVIRLCVHAEPMWIEKGHEAVLSRIIHTTEKTIAEATPGGSTDVFLFAPPGKVSGLAKLAGMQVEPWVVWSKRVIGVEPLPVPSVEDSESESKPETPPERIM